MDAKKPRETQMPNMLLILLRDFADSHGFPAAECYPVIRLSDRHVTAIYVRDRGWFPYSTVSIDRMKGEIRKNVDVNVR